MADRLAAEHEAAEASQAPDLLELVGGDLEQRLAMLRPGVEHRHLDRPVLTLDAGERVADLLLDANVDFHPHGFAALRPDIGGEALELVLVARPHHRLVAGRREAPRDRRAEPFAHSGDDGDSLAHATDLCGSPTTLTVPAALSVIAKTSKNSISGSIP
jgi:hypothetical protein